MKVEKMSIFSGKYKYSLDEKGRINFLKILKRFGIDKENKEEVFYLMKDYVKITGSDKQYPIFYLYTETEWSEFSKLLENEFDDDELSAFTTQYCDETTMDNMQRVSFPKEFLKYIQASKNLFIQGLGNKLQVWSQENFDRYSENLAKAPTAKDYHGLYSKLRKK